MVGIPQPLIASDNDEGFWQVRHNEEREATHCHRLHTYSKLKFKKRKQEQELYNILTF